MSSQIIIDNRVIKIKPCLGRTVLQADAPIRCPICGEFRPFFYHLQIHEGEPSELVCAEICHYDLQELLESHDGDHFLIRGIKAPLPSNNVGAAKRKLCIKH